MEKLELLYCWMRMGNYCSKPELLRILRSYREQELLVGQDSIGRFWNLTIYSEARQYWIFLDPLLLKGFQYSKSSQVSILWVQWEGSKLCPGGSCGTGVAHSQCSLCKMPQELYWLLSCLNIVLLNFNLSHWCLNTCK